MNGEPGELNTFVGKRDVVEVDGRRVGMQPLAYVLLHKPPGVVTTARRSAGTSDGRRPRRARVARGAVGRLDADTTGALLLTNDGDLAHRLAHPRYGVPKVYDADVDGSPKPTRSRRFADGVELEDGRRLRPRRAARPSRDACSRSSSRSTRAASTR